MSLEALDFVTMEYTRDMAGVKDRMTNVSLLENGKFWSSQIQGVPIYDIGVF